MDHLPSGYLFEFLHYLSQEDDSTEAYIDEDGEVVFEIDYEKFVEMLKRERGEDNG
jgi:hypothetical protein|tara:strand:- start:721 stop:888 length:168 start_codon:yes stop_codon:yes gene_type:complete